jgi:type VI secretion system protein ImpE
MDAKELFQSGRLDEAITAQTAEVKTHPTDPERRYLLCAMLGFAGEWERANRQLDALGVQDPKLEAASRIYRNLLASELERRAVHTGTARPLLPGDPAAHVELRLDALEANRADQAATVAGLIERAVEVQPELKGTINGAPFGALRDLDDLLGSVLEVFAGGRYLWLPWEHLRRLELDPPQHLLDLLWAPARLEDVRGATAHVHVPVLYFDSAAADEDALRLGRLTDWEDLGGALYRGRGQRLLAWADGDGAIQELGVLSLRSLELAGDGTTG